MSKRVTFEVALEPHQLSKIGGVWGAYGNRPDMARGLFATVNFKTGMLRLLIVEGRDKAELAGTLAEINGRAEHEEMGEI